MTKIKQILEVWPKNTVAVDPWLKQQGLYSDLRREYIKSGWIKSIGRGAIVRPGDQVAWQGALYPLQRQLNLPIHLGGKSALEIQGYGHFVRFQETTVYLFSKPKLHLPKWFKEGEWNINFIIINSNVIHSLESIAEVEVKSIPLKVSSPDRAFLELLYLVPSKQGFQEAYLIAQGLSGLRPKKMQMLLEQCQSIKVKRLALFFGEYLNHEWFKRLDLKKINLGSGDRSIIKDGKYINKYKITIPKDFENNERY